MHADEESNVAVKKAEVITPERVDSTPEKKPGDESGGRVRHGRTSGGGERGESGADGGGGVSLHRPEG